MNGRIEDLRSGDIGRGIDGVAVKQFRSILDHGRLNSLWRCDKFYDRGDVLSRQLRAGALVGAIAAKYPGSLRESLSVPHNLLLNEGINELWTLLCGTGAVKFDNANANIGVGDDATAADATQTGLQAATNKIYKGMDAGYPTYGTSQKATWRSTYTTPEANWAWNEYTVCNTALDTGKNLNRKVQSLGTKTNSFSWVLTLEITLA